MMLMIILHLLQKYATTPQIKSSLPYTLYTLILMMIDLDDQPVQYEIEKIEKRLSKPNGVWYLVKWVGHTEREWLQSVDLAHAQDAIDKFQRKLKFKKELKQYVADKTKKRKEEDKNVIVIDDEEQAKAIILISDQEEPQIQKPVANTQKTGQEINNNEVANEVQISAADQIVEDLIPEVAPTQTIQVPRYNYLKGTWELVYREKRRLITTAFIRQVLQQYQSRLPKINILRAVQAGDKEMIQFECRGKTYQIHYDVMKRYRQAELLEFYEKKSSLFTRKEYYLNY